MALYEYTCRVCYRDFERNVPMENRDDYQTCSSCGNLCSRKVIASSVQVIDMPDHRRRKIARRKIKGSGNQW